MSQNGKSRRRTWSRFPAERRVPSEYEAVTHDLHYHVGKEVPFEASPSVPWNQWTIKYRNNSAVQLQNPNGFRDPDALIYRTYVETQDDREIYVDGLLAEFSQLHADAGLPGDWVASLREWYTPFRYVGHALQMAAQYVVQMAPSSYVSNCAGFQAADELRRVQRIAYRTKELSLTHPTLGVGESDRATWEDGPSWQPLREVIEKLLVARDWAEAFVRLNLVVKPLVDDAFLGVGSEAARAAGDQLLALMNDDLYLDCQRSRRWSAALVNHMVSDTAANRSVISDWVAQHSPEVHEAVVTMLEPLKAHGVASEEASLTIRERHENFLQLMGLTPAGEIHAPALAN
jgi:toluene monooxygenase system protein E